jgi:hypothetical protein
VGDDDVLGPLAGVGVKGRTMPVPMTAPSRGMAMTGGDAGEGVGEHPPTGTAGLANEVELVNQNPRRGHHELTTDVAVVDRVQATFTELAANI